VIESAGVNLMLRAQNLFAVVAMGLLAFGLLASKFASQTGFVIQAGAHNRGYGFSNQMPLYCMAALFAGFAFLYSIGYIPFSSTMMRWHFWLSLVSVVLCVAGWAIFSWYAECAERIAETKVGQGGTLLAASFALGVLMFVSMQLWFVMDLARALLTMRKT
jgi:hypothetical protein